ncbi:MAG: hypothetical protein E6H47_11275 [Betaproteobacteria bacterium]|nr:MAG: hypothetical protein E6H47_11275 [Betaproteobacteria bacterium]
MARDRGLRVARGITYLRQSTARSARGHGRQPTSVPSEDGWRRESCGARILARQCRVLDADGNIVIEVN